MKTMNAPEKRFKVAFSFAGERRDYVARVARILADKFEEDKILYDKYHEAEFAVYDLGIRLPKLYGEESELIVPVLCPDYDHKKWTGWEWVHIYSLLTKPNGHKVMPSRFEYAIADGLSGAAGFIELDDKTPEAFATLILQRLALNEGNPRDFYTKPVQPAAYAQPHTTIKHNLPRMQPFFGREKELRKIAEALEPENRTWGALIDGPGGMGKTSLAVRAAYDAPAGVFDRILFVSLKSRELDDDGERDVSGFLVTGLQELFNELAQEAGYEDIAKAAMEQRPRLLVDALRGSRTLLVLDNLESLTRAERDILFTFVKRLPDGCKAILTSRGRIGSGAEELILQHLGQGAALETMAELATHNRELAKTTETERIELYRATGGKPLLLRWTAGQIGRGHCLSVRDAIDYLRSCPKGNDPLAFIFGDLVQDFTEAEAKALCALTYFTLPAKAEHIAHVAERLADEITKALKGLVNRSLVVPSTEQQTFALVPLVADFLQKHMPEVLAETGSILEKYVYALVIENGYKKHERFPILEAAWPVIAAALPRLLDGENSRLQQVCDGLTDFLDFTGRWDEWLALSTAAEKKAVAARDMNSAGWRAYHAGWVYYLRGQSTEVISCADRAEQHWQGAGDREKSNALRLRGMGHFLAKNYLTAIESYKEVVTLRRKIDPISIGVAMSLNSLAVAERDSGDYDGAERDYNEALRIARAIDNKEGIAIYTGNLAALVLDREDWPRAEKLAREALLLSERIGRQELVAWNCYCLAKVLAMQDKKAEGLPYARRAVEIFAQLRSPNLAAAEKTLKLCDG